MSCCLAPSSASSWVQYARRSSGSVGTASGVTVIAVINARHATNVSTGARTPNKIAPLSGRADAITRAPCGGRQVDAVEQQQQLRGLDLEMRRARPWQMEHAALQPLVPETEARAVPVENLHLVRRAVEKGEEMPRQGILRERVARQGREP